MNILSLDLELNQAGKPKIIEVGAAVFKSRTGELIETFQTYVDPKEPITPFITGLTRITDENVIGAPSVTEAYFLLKAFHKKHQCTRNPLLWGSGVRNDSQSLHEESGVEEQNFMGFRVIDAKTLYQSLQIHTNGTIKGGLVTACEKMGIPFDKRYGEEHGALADSFNTFQIWFKLIKMMEKGSKL